MNGSGQQQTDQTANFFWLLIIIFGAAIALWFFNERFIAFPILWFRYHELSFLHLLISWWAPAADFLHLPSPQPDQIRRLQEMIANSDPGRLSWASFKDINYTIGLWTRWPIMLLLVGGGVFMYFRYGTAKFRQTYSMKTLKLYGQMVWPQITPVKTIDLVKIDIDEGPWAMAIPPLRFCRENNLLVIDQIDQKKRWALKEKQAHRLFVIQLGPMWAGMAHLPIHAKALALIFLCRATGNRPLSNTLLSQISESASTGKLNFSGVEEALRKYYDHRIVKWLEKRHYYVNTLMPSLLEIARSDGVLASAEFLWLKPIDRKLWYVLNTVGRRTAFVEVAGIYSHWVAEKKVGRGMKTPMVKGAVDALNETLQNILYVDEDEQWHISSGD